MSAFPAASRKTEAKVVISGLYITEIKSVRGGIPPLPKKKGFFSRFKKDKSKDKNEGKSLLNKKLLPFRHNERGSITPLSGYFKFLVLA